MLGYETAISSRSGPNNKKKQIPSVEQKSEGCFLASDLMDSRYKLSELDKFRIHKYGIYNDVSRIQIIPKWNMKKINLNEFSIQKEANTRLVIIQLF